MEFQHGDSKGRASQARGHDRRDVYNDTQYQCNKGAYSEVQIFRSIKLKDLPEPDPAKRMYKNTEIHIIDVDTIDAAIGMIDKRYRPMLLNMADDRNPGGMVNDGSAAQEENLFRRSNYFRTLMPDFYPLLGTECVYSPNVLYFKSNEANHYQLLKKPVYISTLAMPAIRFPAIEHVSDELMFKDSTKRKLMKDKIEMIYKCAIEYGHDTMILSAHGCGAWGGPIHDIARLFKEVSEKYDGYFKYIIFAILNNSMLGGWNKGGNYTTFKNIIM